jgi:thymus-specific serine protease
MIEELFDAGNTTYVEQQFHFCNEMDHANGYDLARFLYSIAEDAYRTIQRATYPEIDDKCSMILGLDTPGNPPADPIEGLARWFTRDVYPNVDCLDMSNEKVISMYADAEWDSISTIDGRRQRLWLKCTQIGNFPVTDGGSDHPYGTRFEINFFKRWCSEAFGNDM